MNSVWILLLGQIINLITVVAIVLVLGYWNKISRENAKQEMRDAAAQIITDINRIKR